MKDYEEKVLNIMESAKDNIKTQLDKAYKSGYEDAKSELIVKAYKDDYGVAKSELGKKVADIAHEERDRAYQQGLEEAWEFIQKLLKDVCDGGYTIPLLQNALGYCNISDIVHHYDISEAIAKIKEYEDKQKQDTEIKVGDEVVLNGNASYENEKAIILAYDGLSYPYNVLMDNGDSEWVKEEAIERKTGRHFDQIAEILEKMRGDKE